MESPAWLGNLPRILGDLGVGVVVWDDETPIYVSPLFSKMIGYTPEELGVRRPAHLYAATNGSGGAKGEFASPVPQFEFKLMHEFEWTLIHKNGRRVGLEAAAGTIEIGGKGQSIGIFCDRSEQERLEDELKTRTPPPAAPVAPGPRAPAATVPSAR